MDEGDWYRPKSYAHFDTPLNREAAIRLACSPDAVARHSFWPVILSPMEVVSRKLEADGRRRIHRKIRPIGHCAHADAQIYACYGAQLGERLEERYLTRPDVASCVLAYRRFEPGKCNVDFALEAFKSMDDGKPYDVVAIDVEGFFDGLDHSLLKYRWKDLLGVPELPKDHYAVFKACTKGAAVSRPQIRDALGGQARRRAGRTRQPICSPDEFRRLIVPRLQPRHELVWTVKKKARPEVLGAGPVGIPQGLPISAVLANLYMWEADCDLARIIQAMGGSYRRYSDDILVIVPAGRGADAEQEVFEALKKVKLEVNPDKTERSRVSVQIGRLQIDEMLSDWSVRGRGRVTYLGLSFDGNTIRLKDGTVSNFIQRATRMIRRAEVAANRRGESKLRRRELLLKLTTLGAGNAYGSPETWRDRRVPGKGFFAYLRRAHEITGSEAIAKQGRQLEGFMFRSMNQTEKRLAARMKRAA